MKTQESREMYLETIYILKKTREHVRAKNICEYMKYSKPSVSRAMGLLRNNNLITVDHQGYIELTESGLALAKKILERHEVLTMFLTQIGIDPIIASKDACRIEHVISDETLIGIKNCLKSGIALKNNTDK